GRLQRSAWIEQADRPRLRRRRQAGTLLGARLPQHESSGEEEEAGGDAGKETHHENLLTPKEIRHAREPPFRRRFCQLPRQPAPVAMRERGPPPSPSAAPPERIMRGEGGQGRQRAQRGGRSSPQRR